MGSVMGGGGESPRVYDSPITATGRPRQRIFVTHGLKKCPEYRNWEHMVQRCCNPNNDRYHRYGGRGIKICDRWRSNFYDFFTDMGPRPTPKHTIDRIDNDGNYEPENCRWATQVEQQHNRNCPSAFKDLTNLKIGMLTILERVGLSGKHILWKCQCDCGNIVTRRGDGLRSGRTFSCGCVVRKRGA